MWAFASLFFGAAAAAPPVDPSALQTWWSAAGNLYLGESAYQVKDVSFSDGVCAFNLTDGALVPVYSGKAPLSERMVGLAFVGKGELEMRFPDRGDSLFFANHMMRETNKLWDDMFPIAYQLTPYQVNIDQGLFLSADPNIPKLLYELEPLGSGVFFTEEDNGEVDATYIVTENRGRLKAQFLATNILADRTDMLEQIGLDPRAMLRQDRLLQDELGFPGEYLRSVMDFRTADRFKIAGQEGGVTAANYDRWLTCFRDGRDASNSGYQAMAFAHGMDSDGRRHFQRFSGERFTSEKPALRRSMEAVKAESQVEIKPARNKMYQDVTVKSTLTLRAEGGDLQYVAMRLPTKGSRRGSFEVLELSTETGESLAWVGLNANLDGTNNANTMSVMDVNASNQTLANSIQSDATDTINTSEVDIATMSLEQAATSAGDASNVNADVDMSGQMIANPTGGIQNFRLNPTEESVGAMAQQVFQESDYRFDIMVLLPNVVKAGEEVNINFSWKGEWQFGSFLTAESNAGSGISSTQVRTLGISTGLNPILPDILPASSETRWSFKTLIGSPTRLLRPQNIVASGETIRAWQDEGLWNWQEVKGRDAIRAGVGVGRYEVYEEPPAQGFPGVRVSLFPSMASFSKQFAPEVRRILQFFKGFFPKFPHREVDIYQTPAITPYQAKNQPPTESRHSAVQIQTIAITALGSTSELREDNGRRAQSQIARQLASQYFEQVVIPEHSRDEWLSKALAESYAAFYIRAAYGIEDYDSRMTAMRRTIEKPEQESVLWKVADAKRRAISPSGMTPFGDVPEKIRLEYSTYVLAEMLRLRIGDQAFFSGVESALKSNKENRYLTTEAFQSAWEESSQQSLQNFFDFWVHGGFVPNITAYVRVEEGDSGDQLYGCLVSDVPFGTFDLPIRIIDQGGDRVVDAFMTIKNGYGEFVAPNRGKSAEIEVDPLGLILAFSRQTKTVSGATPCPSDPLSK